MADVWQVYFLRGPQTLAAKINLASFGSSDLVDAQNLISAFLWKLPHFYMALPLPPPATLSPNRNLAFHMEGNGDVWERRGHMQIALCLKGWVENPSLM